MPDTPGQKVSAHLSAGATASTSAQHTVFVVALRVFGGRGRTSLELEVAPRGERQAPRLRQSLSLTCKGPRR